jgi:hypothetical protein
LPQLDSSTFASQIFWILAGFFLVYLFVSQIFVPTIENMLQKRHNLVDSTLQKAHRLKDDAAEIEKNALVNLENAQLEVAAAELKAIANFREQGLAEKNNLYNICSEKSKRESDLLIKSSNVAFDNVLNDIDELVNASLKSISCIRRSEP